YAGCRAPKNRVRQIDPTSLLRTRRRSSPTPAGSESKESPSLPEAGTVAKKMPRSGISGALSLGLGRIPRYVEGRKRSGGQEKCRGNQSGQECRPGRLNLPDACYL